MTDPVDHRTPIHTHDCDCCVFLGHDVYYKMPVDLYFCPNEPTIIFRHGPDGEYGSGIPFAADDNIYGEVVRRARAAGVWTQEAESELRNKIA